MTFPDMPIALRRYVLAVSICGPVLALLVALRGGGGLELGGWVRALVLVVLATVSYGQPLHITHNHRYDASEVVHVAMILLFPPWLCGLLVLLAGGLHLTRRSNWAVHELFNVGQAVTSLTAGAFCLAVLADAAPLGPSLSGLPSLPAIVPALVTILMVNTGLVAGAIALQTGARFWRQWRAGLASVAGTYTALVALGVVVALIVRDYPIALAPLILPVALAQYAMRREVRLREDTRAALASLVDVIELRDPYTAGHSERVAALARSLAMRLGLTGDEADLVETAGRVHDLGKVALNPAVLVKRGPLDEAEWAEVRQHPGHGAAVVGRFAGYRGCAELVRHHHERWDGAGYPDGLAGEEIPLGARILAVADAFDALTSARSYRGARGPEAAMRILEEGAGSQWDHRVLEALREHRRERTVPASSPASHPVLA